MCQNRTAGLEITSLTSSYLRHDHLNQQKNILEPIEQEIANDVQEKCQDL